MEPLESSVLWPYKEAGVLFSFCLRRYSSFPCTLPCLRQHFLFIVPRCVMRKQRAVCPWRSADTCDVTNIMPRAYWCLRRTYANRYIGYIYICIAVGAFPFVHSLLVCVHTVMVRCLGTHLGQGYGWPFVAFEHTQDTHTHRHMADLHKTWTHIHPYACLLMVHNHRIHRFGAFHSSSS